MGVWPPGLEGVGLKSLGEALIETRTTCRVCGSRNFRLILDYGEMPLAGGFFEAGDARSHQRFPLHLVQCEDCTLLQVAETVDPAAIFGTYSYESSVNRTLVEHNRRLGDFVETLAGADGLVVEFGCNDGVFLNPLWARGIRVVGVDPSDVAVRASEKAGWPLIRSYFGAEAALQIRAQFGQAQIIVANNVCAHVDDPNVLIAGVAELLAPEGRFICEVHYQGDLIIGGQFDTVYHEHTCYYSLRALQRLLSFHGLRIAEVERNAIHSGSIRVTAVHINSSLKQSPAVEALLLEEADLDVSGFAAFAQRQRRLLHTLIVALQGAGKRIVGYGASGRATVLMNFCELGPDLIEHVSDLSPLRYDRVVPGVGVPIRPRKVFHENYPDYALMTAWNYESEIVADEQTFLRKGGAFIVPLKEARII